MALTKDERIARQDEIRARLKELDTNYVGDFIPPDSDDGQEWSRLNDEFEENRKALEQIAVREQRLNELSTSPAHTEEGASFNVRGGSTTRNEDIWDLTTIRSSASSPQEARHELHERAQRAIERENFPHLTDQAAGKAHVERLLRTSDDEHGTIARRILATGSPAYRRAFGKAIAGAPFSSEDQRTLSLTTTAGGFAVPYQLDPTVIPTSNSSVNPYRAISKVISIPGDEWKGVSSAGITASYDAEVTETDDDAPVLAQPAISTEKAQAFVPFSIEIGMDWGSLQSEMAIMLQDAKDDLEATKFTTGAGSGSNEPFGVITGATNTLSAAGSQAFTIANLYALEEALPPRYRPRATFVANRAIYNKVRQFDTAGGSGVWLDGLQPGLNNEVPVPGGIGPRVLGYPAREASAMASTSATGNKFLIFGDFSRFVIVDRVGLTVEVVPHLFGTARNYPSGQRGLYAYWRNSSKVVDANGFRVLQGIA